MASTTQVRRIRVAALRRLGGSFTALESAARRNANRLNTIVKRYPASGNPDRHGMPGMEELEYLSENIEGILNTVEDIAQGLERTEELFKQPI